MAATARNVDMSDVKEGGSFRPRRKSAGDYVAKIVKVDDHQPNNKDKGPGWVYTIQVEGDARSTYPYYVNPAPKEKWKIRTISVAAGINIKLSRIKFDPNKLVGKAVGIELEDDEYEGRAKSVIADIFPVSEVGSAGEDAPEGDDYIPDDEVEGDDEPVEDEDLGDPEPEPEPAPRRRRKPAPEPEPEPEDDDDYEEDEPEPEPAPRKRRTTAPATKAVALARKRAAAPAAPADEDEDDDLDLDDLD